MLCSLAVPCRPSVRTRCSKDTVLLQAQEKVRGHWEPGNKTDLEVPGMLQAGPGLGSFLSHLPRPQGSSVPTSFVFLTNS